MNSELVRDKDYHPELSVVKFYMPGPFTVDGIEYTPPRYLRHEAMEAIMSSEPPPISYSWTDYHQSQPMFTLKA